MREGERRERELVFANTRSARDRNFAGVQKSRGGISADAPIDGMSKRRMDCRSLKGADHGCRRDFGEEFRVGEASVTGRNTRGPEGTVAMMKRCGPRDSK